MMCKKLLIYFLLCVLIYSNYSPIVQGTNFPFTNCYESFSNPKFVFKLHLHTPSGPDYMSVSILSQIHYDDRKRKMFTWDATHHFKRVPGKCEHSNIIFATDGKYFEKMFVVIKLYLSQMYNQMAHIHYTFIDEFRSDNYTLKDQFENFGISVQVMYSKNQLFPDAIPDLNKTEYFLRSLPHYNHICVVTEFYHQIIINHKYDSLKPEGYIVGIMAQLEYSSSDIKRFEYNSFECDVDAKYFYTPVLFVTEGNPILIFKAIYVKSNDQNKQLFKDAYFSVYNIFKASLDSKLISEYDKKIYLIEKKLGHIPCKYGTKRIISQSKIQIINHLIEERDFEVDDNVKQQKFLICHYSNPCDC